MSELRDMRSEDLQAVLSIERNAQLSPWSRLSFEESLNREHYCRVLEHDGLVVAYHVICATSDELHVLNVVVAKPQQGQGFAHHLMQDIFDYAQSLEEITAIYLEVRASNHVAQHLYERWGFAQTAIRKAYYQAINKKVKREDAIIMCRRLASC